MLDYAHRTNRVDPSMRRLALEYEHVGVSRSAASTVARMDRSERLAPLVELRERTYRAVVGGFGADIGCGRGLAVAELVERGVEAVGVDNSQLMTQAARRRFPLCTFVTASADALPFSDGALRWYRAERTYGQIRNPASALAEGLRVLAPGGQMIVVDYDWDSTVIASADPGVTRAVLGAFADAFPAGHAGTRLPQWLSDAGFVDISVSTITMVFTDLRAVAPSITTPAIALAVETGAVSVRQAHDWMMDLRQRASANQFMLATTLFMSLARVPDPASDEDEAYG